MVLAQDMVQRLCGVHSNPATPRPQRPSKPASWGARSCRLGLLLFILPACGAAGPYGYSRTYAPLDGEEDAASDVADYDPVMVNRKPRAWIGKRVSVFGVVQESATNPDGSQDLLLGIRTLQHRNLCESDDESTCRVTVSEGEFGHVHARVTLRPENKQGADRLTPGALIRVIGTIDAKPHTQTGNTVITASYYRVWPLRQFVTTAARSYMLR